jgi:hypothetical protein
MALPHKISRFLALSAADRRTFCHAMILLPLAAASVLSLGIKRTFAWLNRAAPTRGEPALAQARRTAALVRKAIRHSPIQGKCLSQSLVLWHLLRRQGIRGELCIGVGKEMDEAPIAVDNFNAHAWVEYQGVVLNDRPDVRQRFAAFERAIRPPE